MDEEWFEAYLDELTGELQKLGIDQDRIRAEVSDHLLESLEHELRNGSDRETAQRKALERFGPARQLAAQFYSERSQLMQKILAAIALLSGLFIAYIDSRPTWDDTGITAMGLLAISGLLGIVGPKRPWLWALLVGIWMPAYYVITRHDYAIMITLVFPLLGAYAGMAVRRLIIDKLIPTP